MRQLIPHRFLREERGSIAILDLVVAMIIVGILTVALMGVVTSVFTTTTIVQNRADFVEQSAVLSERLRMALTGSAPAGLCINRVNPSTTVSVSNCQNFAEGASLLVSGSATSVCVLVGAPKGLDTTTGAPVAPVILQPNEQVCVQTDENGFLIMSRRVADASTDYVTATWSAAAVQTELISSKISDLSFSYFDIDSNPIVPAPVPVTSVLSDLQLEAVRRVVAEATLVSSSDRIGDSVIVEIAVGAGRFVGEQRWQGR
jgi:type II secretory pathway pseudopilin PulG